MTATPRLWFDLETGDYWIGTAPMDRRAGLTLFRASDVRSPMDVRHAAKIIADDEDAMAFLSYTAGAQEGRLHLALEELARKGTT